MSVRTLELVQNTLFIYPGHEEQLAVQLGTGRNNSFNYLVSSDP